MLVLTDLTCNTLITLCSVLVKFYKKKRKSEGNNFFTFDCIMENANEN